ncbi:hypothetical protein C5S31_03570, partial [ANME-1 cluster archaeon GoMg2]|nr:hypothetical protein [ANME-1 cluster archaeon GoMg2]
DNGFLAVIFDFTAWEDVENTSVARQ